MVLRRNLKTAGKFVRSLCSRYSGHCCGFVRAGHSVVEEISVASQEQSQGIETVSQAIADKGKVTQ